MKAKTQTAPGAAPEDRPKSYDGMRANWIIAKQERDTALARVAALESDNARLSHSLEAIAEECERQGETEYTYEIGRTARAALAGKGDK